MGRYVELAELLALHEEIIRQKGGTFGVRDQSLLESALARPRAGFGDYEAYPDIFTKAAVLLHSLVKNHGFVDGNKRTGFVTAITFLGLNGYILSVSQKEVVEFVVRVAEGKQSEEEIASWIKQHSQADI